MTSTKSKCDSLKKCFLKLLLDTPSDDSLSQIHKIIYNRYKL